MRTSTETPAALIIMAALLTGAGCAPGETALEAGQRWSYATRAGEVDSRLTIVKLETVEPFGDVVFVAVDGIRIRHPEAPGGYMTRISPMPFAPEAVRRSIIALEAENVELPEFEVGYESWKSASSGGGASIYRGTVGEVLEGIDRSINDPPPAPDPAPAPPAENP